MYTCSVGSFSSGLIETNESKRNIQVDALCVASGLCVRVAYVTFYQDLQKSSRIPYVKYAVK